MENRSLHLFSALRLHSYPQADVRAAPHFFSLEEVSPQWTKPGFLQLLWIDESKTVRHGHNTATAAISSALSNSNKCERDTLHALPGSSFNRVYKYTAGVDEQFKGGKIPGMTEFHLTASTLEYSFKLHSRWKDNFNKETMFWYFC